MKSNIMIHLNFFFEQTLWKMFRFKLLPDICIRPHLNFECQFDFCGPRLIKRLIQRQFQSIYLFVFIALLELSKSFVGYFLMFDASNVFSYNVAEKFFHFSAHRIDKLCKALSALV